MEKENHGARMQTGGAVDSLTAPSNEQIGLPWEVAEPEGIEEGLDACWGIRRHGETSGMSIAQMVWKEDADFIVRACNVHDELLAALKCLRYIAANNLCGCITSSVFDRTDAAIAKAEGR